MHFFIVKMHTEQTAPFLQLFPHKHPLPHPTTTHEFIGAYFIQIPPPPGWPGISQDDSNEVLKSIEK